MGSTIRIITGTILILLGLGLTIFAIFTSLFLLIYSIPAIIIGIIILANKNEDKIERRKDLKEKEYAQ